MEHLGSAEQVLSSSKQGITPLSPFSGSLPLLTFTKAAWKNEVQSLFTDGLRFPGPCINMQQCAKACPETQQGVLSQQPPPLRSDCDKALL